MALFRPFSSAVALAWVVGIWLIMRGVMEIVAAFGQRGSSRWALLAGGVLWAIAGILVVSNPGAAAVGASLWLGILAILWGVLLIGGGLAVRSPCQGGQRGQALT